MTYDSAFKNLSQVIRKNLQLLYADEQVTMCFHLPHLFPSEGRETLKAFKVCGLQHVGSTTDKFRLRRNNYKENNRKAKRGEEHMQPLVLENFSSNDHNGFLVLLILTKQMGLIPLEERNTGEEY